MAGPHRSNGSATRQQAEHLIRSVTTGSDDGATEMLLNVSSQLSRKLSWALSTAWETSTGRQAPRGLINDLASKYAVELTLALRDSLPLHLTTLAPPPPEQSGEGG